MGALVPIPRPVSVPSHTWVIAYDIADDRRLARVASEMENFGRRVQYSVFECHLSEAQIRDLETGCPREDKPVKTDDPI